MAVIRVIRFAVEPARSEEMLLVRTGLIEQTRQRFPGLTQTRLARVDERHWVDQWRWESAAQMQAAVAAAPTIPGAQQAFALMTDIEPTVAEIVAEEPLSQSQAAVPEAGR